LLAEEAAVLLGSFVRADFLSEKNFVARSQMESIDEMVRPMILIQRIAYTGHTDTNWFPATAMRNFSDLPAVIQACGVEGVACRWEELLNCILEKNPVAWQREELGVLRALAKEMWLLLCELLSAAALDPDEKADIVEKFNDSFVEYKLTGKLRLRLTQDSGSVVSYAAQGQLYVKYKHRTQRQQAADVAYLT